MIIVECTMHTHTSGLGYHTEYMCTVETKKEKLWGNLVKPPGDQCMKRELRNGALQGKLGLPYASIGRLSSMQTQARHSVSTHTHNFSNNVVKKMRWPLNFSNTHMYSHMHTRNIQLSTLADETLHRTCKSTVSIQLARSPQQLIKLTYWGQIDEKRYKLGQLAT